MYKKIIVLGAIAAIAACFFLSGNARTIALVVIAIAVIGNLGNTWISLQSTSFRCKSCGKTVSYKVLKRAMRKCPICGAQDFEVSVDH